MNKKGFTLVELLAVIAILAILVIIALPNVMGMFNSAKKNTFETEVKKIYRGAEQAYVQDSFNSSGTKIYSKCKSGCSNELDMSIRDDLEYYIEINSKGKVIKYYAKDNSFQYSYENPDGIDVSDIKGIQSLSDLNDDEIITIGDVIEPPLPEGDPELGNYFITNNGTYFTSLADAFDAVSSNQTIKVLANSTETKTATLGSDKTGVKLDLNGKSVVSKGINNNGTLDIYNSSATEATISKGSPNYIIYNNGTLTLNGTSNTNKFVIDLTINNTNGAIYNKIDSTLTINENVEVKVTNGSSYPITNYGITTITGGTFNGGGNVAINNSSFGVLNINGNNVQIISTSSNAINNCGTINIYNGTINSSSRNGLNNTTCTVNSVSYTGTANIYGGSITGSSFGINSSGTTNISGGTITGNTNGIYSSGTTTITGGTITSNSTAIYIYILVH